MKEKEEKKREELKKKYENSDSGHMLGGRKDDNLRPG